MKFFVIILQVLVILGIQLNAKEPSFPSVEEFLTLTPERATQILNTPTGGYQREIYARAAVASGRTELVMACFENPRTWNYALSSVAALPESPQRDALTILMLKTPSNLWPWEGIDDAPRLIPKEVMDEPFASLVRRLLPGHPIGDEAVSTTEKRLKLAAELEAALGQKQSSETTPELPSGDAPVAGAPAGTSPKPASTPLVQPPQPKVSSSWFWLTVLAILGVTMGLLYWLLKQRK